MTLVRFTATKGRASALAGIAAAAAVALLPGAAAGRAPEQHAHIDGFPIVSGTAQAGEVLTASASWSPDDATPTWSWLRCADSRFRSCVPIDGADESTYTVADADVGQSLRAFLTVVTADGRSRAWAYSAQTGDVAARPEPTPSPSPSPEPGVTPTPTPVPIALTPPPDTGGVKGEHVTSPPRMMRPAPVVRIRGWLTSAGAHVTLLTVRAPRGARVRVRCLGSKCPRRRWAHTTTLVHLVPFERELRAGTRLLITVTKRGYIGKYTLLRLRHGRSPARLDRCLYPGSLRPRRCPAA
jgi:hypothetical protein